MSKKALQNYPGHTKFVFDVPMYSKFRISEDDAIQLVCTGATIDGLCVVCGEKRVFRGKLVLGIADGWLEADGRRIYEAKDLRVGLFKPEAVPAA